MKRILLSEKIVDEISEVRIPRKIMFFERFRKVRFIKEYLPLNTCINSPKLNRAFLNVALDIISLIKSGNTDMSVIMTLIYIRYFRISNDDIVKIIRYLEFNKVIQLEDYPEKEYPEDDFKIYKDSCADLYDKPK